MRFRQCFTTEYCTVIFAATTLVHVPLVSMASKSINPLLIDVKLPTSGKIIGGMKATPHEFPWLIDLWFLGKHQCGGSVLNEHFILTAAHCLDPMMYKTQGIHVTIAEHNNRCQEGPETVRKVTDFRMHQEYDRVTHWNDIAVIRVVPPIVLGRYVGTLKLPKDDFVYPDMAEVAGWGRLTPPGGTFPAMLRKVTHHRTEDSDCFAAYHQEFSELYNVCYGAILDEDDNKGDCKADSGGPVLCSTPNGVVACAMVGWGEGCILPGYPSVYVKIPNYVDWIKQHSNISVPWPPLDVTGCGKYFKGYSAHVSLKLPARSQCHITIESDFVKKRLDFKKFTLASDDEIWLTDISHICKDCKPILLNPRDINFNLAKTSLFIITIIAGDSGEEVTRSVEFVFTVKGERAKRTPLTDIVFRGTKVIDTAAIDHPSSPKGPYYYDSENILIILSQRIYNPTTITFSFIRMNIADDKKVPGCQGDHLSFFILDENRRYQEAKRFCGKGPTDNFTLPADGLVLLQFVSTPDSPFGLGFSVEYGFDV